ncbi:MAG TPA: pilus assembly protein PilM [Candidatus Omnitrophota bacterium]|nr:pilus assembly protein PilM [Candidatus Omnitrophota bacterium]
MNIKGSHFIIASFNEETLKVAEIKGLGTSTRITNVTEQNVKGVTAEELPGLIQKAFLHFKAKQASLLYSIAPTMLTTKNIEIPSVNPEEIKSIVNLQASRHTPFTREEIQIGYINIGVYKKNYSKVLLIIANKNVLKDQLLTFQKAGLNFKNVLFPAEAIAAFYARILKQKAKAAPEAVIDIGRNSTEFIVIHKGQAITTRSIPVGKSQLNKEGMGAQTRLIGELNQTIESYQTEDIEVLPARYVLTSDDTQTQSLKSMLKEKLNWNVDIVPYIDHVKVAKPLLKRMATEFSETSFLDLAASAAMIKETKVSLVPEELQFQKSIEEQGKEVFKAALLSILLLILVGAALGLKIYYKSSFLQKLKDDNAVNRQAVEKLETLSEKTKIVKNFLETRMDSLDTIYELYSRIPDEVYLTSIDMDESGNVSIQGVSDVASIVFNLGTSLKESAFFKSVDIKSTTSKKDRGKDVSAFEITLTIHSSPSANEPAEPKE